MHDELEKPDIASQQIMLGSLIMRYELALVLSAKMGIRLQVTSERPRSPGSPAGRPGGPSFVLDQGKSLCEKTFDTTNC